MPDLVTRHVTWSHLDPADDWHMEAVEFDGTPAAVRPLQRWLAEHNADCRQVQVDRTQVTVSVASVGVLGSTPEHRVLPLGTTTWVVWHPAGVVSLVEGYQFERGYLFTATDPVLNPPPNVPLPVASLLAALAQSVAAIVNVQRALAVPAGQATHGLGEVVQYEQLVVRIDTDPVSLMPPEPTGDVVVLPLSTDRHGEVWEPRESGWTLRLPRTEAPGLRMPVIPWERLLRLCDGGVLVLPADQLMPGESS